jgi:hypothetical protein
MCCTRPEWLLGVQLGEARLRADGRYRGTDLSRLDFGTAAGVSRRHGSVTHVPSSRVVPPAARRFRGAIPPQALRVPPGR